MNVQLKVPTDRVEHGVGVVFEDGVLQVTYDGEDDDGSSVWAYVLFKDVLTFRFWDNATSPARNIGPPKEVVEKSQSEYLEASLSAWKERIGQRAEAGESTSGGLYKHFTMYFDDAGSVEVIASRCELGW